MKNLRSKNSFTAIKTGDGCLLRSFISFSGTAFNSKWKRVVIE